MDRIEKTRKYLNSVIEELREHPIRYPLRKGAEVVRDNWDLAAVMVGAIAAGDYKGEMLGELRPHLVNLGFFAGVFGPGYSLVTGRDAGMRFMRNFYAGLGVYALSFQDLAQNITTTAILGPLAYFSDRMYRRENRTANPELQLQLQ